MTGKILPGRSRTLTALVGLGLIAIIGVTLAVQPFRFAATRLAFASHVTRPVQRFIPGFPQAPLQPGLTAQPVAVQMSVPGIYPHTIGLILLLVGVLGLVLSMLYWWPRRQQSNQAPDGPSYS